MYMYCLFLVLSLVYSSNESHHQIVKVTEDYELEEFLCSGTQLLDDTTVKLWENKIVHSTVTGLPPLLKKVCYSCLVVSKEASMAQKANLVRKCLEKIRGALTVPEKDSRRLYDRAWLDLSKICTDFFLSYCLLS